MSKTANCFCCASVLALLAACLGPAPAGALTYRVPGNNALTMAAALAQATTGDTVLVSPGHYSCSVSMHGGVTLLGSGGAGSVTLDGQGAGAVITLIDAGGNTWIGNITLTGGTGALVGGSREGGAVYGIRSSPVLSRVRMTANSAVFGGGAYFEQGSPSLRGCSVDHNTADYGGGVAMNGCAGRLDTCTVQFNAASQLGGGLMALNAASVAAFLGDFTSNTSGGDGGGFYFLNSAGSLVSMTIQDNTALGDGGALCGSQGAAVDVIQNVVWKNHARRGGGAYLGCGQPAYFRPQPAPGIGARSAATSACGVYHLTSNTFFDNAATVAGSSVAVNDGAQARLLTNILVSLSSGGYGVACLDLRSQLDFRCNDAWHNSPANWDPGCQGGGDPALTNLSVNPFFCDPLAGGFALCQNSPLLNSAQCGAQLIGAMDQACSACRTPARASSWGSLRRLYLSRPDPASGKSSSR